MDITINLTPTAVGYMLTAVIALFALRVILILNKKP